MKQTRKMVVAAAAAVGAVAGGAIALANVPVGAAPAPTNQTVVASSTPSPVDPDEAAERARLEEEIATSQRVLDRLASASPTAAAAVANGDTVTVQGGGASSGTNSSGANSGGQGSSGGSASNGGGSNGGGALTPVTEPSSDTWTGASGSQPGSGYDDDDDEYDDHDDDDHDDDDHDDDDHESDDEHEGDDD